jgi:hypothetical protein
VEHVDAGAVRHAQVGEDETERSARNLLRRGARVGRLGDRVPGALERQAQHAPQAVFVFNEQNIGHVEPTDAETLNEKNPFPALTVTSTNTVASFIASWRGVKRGFPRK